MTTLSNIVQFKITRTNDLQDLQPRRSEGRLSSNEWEANPAQPRNAERARAHRVPVALRPLFKHPEEVGGALFEVVNRATRGYHLDIRATTERATKGDG